MLINLKIKITNVYLFCCLPVIEELKATGKFEMMDLHVDEAEHSMEMHLPYLAKVFDGLVFWPVRVSSPNLHFLKINSLNDLNIGIL